MIQLSGGSPLPPEQRLATSIGARLVEQTSRMLMNLPSPVSSNIMCTAISASRSTIALSSNCWKRGPRPPPMSNLQALDFRTYCTHTFSIFWVKRLAYERLIQASKIAVFVNEICGTFVNEKFGAVWKSWPGSGLLVCGNSMHIGSPGRCC